jgi:hypothetical protein
LWLAQEPRVEIAGGDDLVVGDKSPRLGSAAAILSVPLTALAVFRMIAAVAPCRMRQIAA